MKIFSLNKMGSNEPEYREDTRGRKRKTHKTEESGGMRWGRESPSS
jgi:hypothetical protein